MVKKLSFSFLPIPEELMVSKALSFGAKILFGIIAKANRESIKWSVGYLSKRMKCSTRETTRRITELKENSLILVFRRGGKTNEYMVNLELVQATQIPDPITSQDDTPDQSVRGQNSQGRGDSSCQGGDDHGGRDSKERLLKKTIKEDGIKKIIPTGEPPVKQTKEDLENLGKLKKMKVGLVNKMSVPTEIKENV